MPPAGKGTSPFAIPLSFATGAMLQWPAGGKDANAEGDDAGAAQAGPGDHQQSYLSPRVFQTSDDETMFPAMTMASRTSDSS